MLAIVAYVYATRAPTGTTPGGQAAPLVVGTTDDEITFDPADSYDSFSINFIQNTMAMLLTYVPGTTDLTTTGALLTSVPTLANGGITTNELTYTLHIRANATFENGVAINSAVVKYSIDRVVKLNGEPAFLLDPIVGASAYWNAPAGTQKDSAWANYTAQGVQVVDPLTVRINLNRKWSPFDSLLAFTITAPVDPNSFTNDKFYPSRRIPRTSARRPRWPR